MRLLGGILRPSRYQVTCGCGKLRMRGAGTTAPSPWETDWTRSPSSKLPMTAGGGQRREEGEKTGGGGEIRVSGTSSRRPGVAMAPTAAVWMRRGIPCRSGNNRDVAPAALKEGSVAAACGSPTRMKAALLTAHQTPPPLTRLRKRNINGKCPD